MTSIHSLFNLLKIKVNGAHLVQAISVSLLLLSLPTSAMADSYQVELIVFHQPDFFKKEVQRLDTRLAYPSSIKTLGSNGSNFGRLESTQQQLNNEAITLNSSKSYRVLFHQAWQQTASANSPWVAVSGGKAIGERSELEGAVRLIKKRHLHLEANLWRLNAKAMTAMEAVNTGGDTVLLPPKPWQGLPDKLVAASSLSVINDKIKLKVGELTYLDNPKFGLLVMVTPL